MQPSRKIAQLNLGIGELEQRRAALALALEELDNRPLVGVQVSHRSYGDGEVVGQQGKHFTVAFAGGQKQFLYPDAFLQTYLTSRDDALQEDLARYPQLQSKISSVQCSIRTAQRQIEKLKKK